MTKVLSLFNDIIYEDFNDDASIAAPVLRTFKGRRPYAGVRAIGTVGTIRTICTITNILRLSRLHHAINEDFDFDAAMRATTLCANKRGRLNAGIRTICAVRAVYTIAEILRLTSLNHAIHENFDFYTAICAASLRPNKRGRLNAGICAICAVRAICTIGAICPVADILCLPRLHHAFDEDFDFDAAIITAALCTIK